MPVSVSVKFTPGKLRAFNVNVAFGELKALDPLKVMSGIILLIKANFSPSAISIGADYIKEDITDPTSSKPLSWLYK